MKTNTIARLALMGGAIALAACAKDKPDTTTTTDSAAGAMNSGTGMSGDSSAMGNMSGMNANNAAFTDPNIVAWLDAVNMADSAGGKLASTKGTSKAVRDFGVEMMKAHHALRAQGQALAKKDNVTPNAAGADSTKQKAQATMASMESMAKGAAWDKAYIDNEVQMHEQVLSNAKAAAAATQNAELRALIEKAAPTIQAHLDMARSIQKTLTPSA